MKPSYKIKFLSLVLFGVLPFVTNAQTPPAYAWVQQTFNSSGILFSCVATDNVNQAVYASGYLSFGGADFDDHHGTHILSPGSGNTMFLIKYTMGGALVWAKLFEGNAKGLDATGIACDPSGNVFVTGYNESNSGSIRKPDTIDFGNSVKFIDHNQQGNAFLVKFDKDGKALWAKGGLGGDSSEIESHAITIDAQGNAYITGQFYYYATFGGTTLINPLTLVSDIFIVKYDPNGNVVWAKKTSGAGWIGWSIAVDKSNNCYVAGNSEGNYANRTLIKFDKDGNFQWQRNEGIWQGNSTNNSVSCDDAGNVYVSGNMALWTVKDVNTNFKEDMFIQKFNSNGDSLWRVQFDSSLHATNIYSKADASGNLYTVFTVVANNNATYMFGSYPLKVKTSTLINQAVVSLVMKWTTSGVSDWGTVVKPGTGMFSLASNKPYAIDYDNAGNLYFTGIFHDSAYFGPISAFGSAQGELYLAELGTKKGGIDESNIGISDKNITIYPNPGSGNVNIHFENAIDRAEISIYGITGNLIKSIKVDNTQDVALINLNLLPGAYLCRIVSNHPEDNISSVYSHLVIIR